MWRSWTLALVSIAVLLVPKTVDAQTPSPLRSSGTPAQIPRLSGRVVDPSGAVMLGVDVRIYQGTNLIKEGKTDERGTFSFDLPADDYRIEAIAEEVFTPFRQDVRLQASSTITIPMKLASVNTVVDAGAGKDEVSLDEDKNLTSTTISGEALKDLPEDEDAMLNYLQQIAAGSGAVGTAANVIVDGFAGGKTPTKDQIQTIIIDSNVFSAEGNGGPRIQIITKPGVGPWSGGMNFSFNDESMNAKNPWDPNKPSRQRRQFFTNYGGPVIPGKLTMRFNASEFEFESGGSSVNAVTPDGPVNKGIVSPLTNRSVSVSGQLFLTPNNTLNFGVNYGINKQENGGVGGINLPERAFNNKGHSWGMNFQTRSIIGTKTIYETRFLIRKTFSSTKPVSDAPAINVLDAFNGGGAQNYNETTNRVLNFGSTLRLTLSPKLNLQAGMDGIYTKRHSLSESNYGGSFTFSSLDDYIEKRPFMFRQSSGNPVLDVGQLEYAAFIQASYQLRSKTTIGAGLRYQLQTNLKDLNNLGPTFQYAYQVTKKTVVRAGGRLTFQTFNINNVEQLLRYDGTTRQFETVILNPSYPNPFDNGSGTTSDTSSGSIRIKAPDLHTPYTINSAVTLEQTLPRNWRASVSFDLTRGIGIIRTRNINAPFPGTPLSDDLQSRLFSTNPAIQGAAKAEVDRLKPYYPLVGNINMYESAGKSRSKNFTVSVFTPANFKVNKIGINALVRYTLGHAYDDASAQNQYDWRSEWARSSFDIRHRLLSTLSFRLPKATSLSFFINASSGRPYTITTGRDNNGDQNAADRPAGVARNSLIGPGSYNVTGNFSKQWNLRKSEPARTASGPAVIQRFAEPQIVVLNGSPAIIGVPPPSGGPGAAPVPKMTFTLSANNLLNNTQLRGYSGVLTSPLFGKPIGGTAQGRQVTAGLNFTF
jgi:Carboxypeptidase regulatory-like domain